MNVKAMIDRLVGKATTDNSYTPAETEAVVQLGIIAKDVMAIKHSLERIEMVLVQREDRG